MVLSRVQDCCLGAGFLLLAPFIPDFAGMGATLMPVNVDEVTGAFTLIIQFLSAVLLVKRIMKKNDEKKS